MRLVAVLFVVSLAGAGAAFAAPTRSPEAMRKLAGEVVAAPEYQTTLPSAADGDVNDAEHAGNGGARPSPEPQEIEPEEPPSGILGSIASWFLYVVIAAVVVVLAFWLVTELSGRPKNFVAGDPRAPTPVTAQDAVVARPLGDAEAFARDGRFAEAIHTLLLRTLEELVRRRAVPLPRSLTSREILVRVALPDAARGALAGLVTATELCWFGGATPGAEDYQLCVERFRSFAAAYVSSQTAPGVPA